MRDFRLCASVKRRKLDPAALSRSLHVSASIHRNRDDRTIAIIGGGLGGLSTAHFVLKSLSPAARARTRICIVERQAQTGGWCRTERFDIHGKPVVFETGPRSLRPVGLSGWLTIQMAHDAGLDASIMTVPKTAASARKRYLLMPDSQTLQPAPNTLSSLVRTLLTSSDFRSAMRGVASEPFKPRSSVHDDAKWADESVDSFFTRRFGKTMAETYVSAIIHGIYSGDTRRLSMRAVFPALWEAERANGSVFRWLWARLRRRTDASRPFEKRRALERDLLKMVQDEIESTEKGKALATAMRSASVWGLKGGLQTLVDHVKGRLTDERVQVMTSTHIDKVERREDRWSLQLDDGTSLHADHYVASSPATLPPSFSQPSIPKSTVAVVSLAFPPSEQQQQRLVPPGFGYLIPRVIPASLNPHHALGVIFDSDVMPGIDASAELGLTKLSILFGGSYWLDHSPPANQPTHDKLVSMALETLRMHFPSVVDWPEPVKTLSNMQVDCIPQLPPGIGRDLARLHGEMRATNENERMPTVSVVGGGPSGVGINAVVQSAWEVGTSIARSIEDDSRRVLTGLERWDEAEQ